MKSVNKLSVALLSLFLISVSVAAAADRENGECFTVLVGRKASADGSVMHIPGSSWGTFTIACSVPTIIHEEWLREGYDMTREPAHKTIARLKARGLDAFIATNKRI